MAQPQCIASSMKPGKILFLKKEIQIMPWRWYNSSKKTISLSVTEDECQRSTELHPASAQRCSKKSKAFEKDHGPTETLIKQVSII